MTDKDIDKKELVRQFKERIKKQNNCKHVWKYKNAKGLRLRIPERDTELILRDIPRTIRTCKKCNYSQINYPDGFPTEH